MNFLIRADASLEIGSGHVMRTLALAQGLRREGHGVSFLHVCPQTLRSRLSSQGFDSIGLDTTPGTVADAAATIRRAGETDAEWVIADGYNYSSGYQRFVQEAGFRILLLDDNGHADAYPADLVLNQSLHADPSLYADSHDDRRFLLGPDYALFREDFRRWIGNKRVVNARPKRLLVSLGGLPDPMWMSRVLEALSDLELDVSVVGGMPPSYLGHSARESSLELLPNVGNMANLIMRCDIGLTAGGGTTKEFLFLGLPFAVVDVADNQEKQSRYLGDCDLARRLGSVELLQPHQISLSIRSLASEYSERVRLTEMGQRLIDGYGVDRVVARLTMQ